VTEWEYRKIALNQMSRKTDDVDLLCDAGEEGWELVAILPNNVAYLKREVEDEASEATAGPQPAVAEDYAAPAAKGYEVKAKYRDPKTNETWSGRGRMASWLKRKQDAGENIDEYLI
jgi:DNA-binding protein H-NS